MVMNDLLRAAVRPESYTAQVREAASLAITATMWPFGWVDRGITELRSKVAADSSPIETPVLLIHGYGANKSNWFFLDRQLRQAGFQRLHALNYNPLRETIPEIAGRCTLRARELMEHFGTDRIHLVGHSCGGVVARYAIQLGGLEGVDTCVTIASPHQGSPLWPGSHRAGPLARLRLTPRCCAACTPAPVTCPPASSPTTRTSTCWSPAAGR